MEKELFLFW